MVNSQFVSKIDELTNLFVNFDEFLTNFSSKFVKNHSSELSEFFSIRHSSEFVKVRENFHDFLIKFDPKYEETFENIETLRNAKFQID